VVGDVTDERLVNTVISEYRPDIVFHAAAHKHVPLMELNPCEAVKNNVLGTRVTATAAAAHGVRRFILISTDKAVNPSSVMGATKRVAELLLAALKAPDSCVFTAVRFGNVLGSNGSVLPRFLRQIEAGGPVTVTHPEVRRYFMLIPEAVQLVLHAAALGTGGDMFVLEMGEQIKVVDMARNVIRLAGFVPDQEVPITFIGLRAGEKLYEELVGHDEIVEWSGVPEIRRVRRRGHADRDRILAAVAELEGRALSGDAKAVIEQLREIVPTYRPVDDTGGR
jgi:FlaA1/EpsC-like NDP-sugar epimerase